MTRKCIVPRCKSGYASNKERVSLFHIPRDPELRAKWINVIPPTKLVLTPSHAVCEKHFKTSDIQRNYIHKDADGNIIANVAYQFPRLSKTAVPSIFPSLDNKKTCGIMDSTKCSVAVVSAESKSNIRNSVHPSVSHDDTSAVDVKCFIPSLKADSPTNHGISVSARIEENNSTYPISADTYYDWEPVQAMEIDESVSDENTNEKTSGPAELDISQRAILDHNYFEECSSDDTSTSDHITSVADKNPDETEDREPSFEDLFNDLFDNPNAIALPSGWFRYTSTRQKKWIAFSTFDTKIESSSLHPLPRRSVVLTQEGDVQTSANGKTFPYKNLCRTLESVRTIVELSRLLTTLSRVELCNGLILSGSLPTQRTILYQDHFGDWRSENCSIICSSRICAACQRSKKSINQRKRRLAKQQNENKTDCSYRNLDEKSKSIFLLKRLRSQKAVLRRARERAKKLKNDMSLAQNLICESNEKSIIERCKKLNLPHTQQMCIREMIAAAGKKSSTGNRYAEDWIMSCLLMHLRSPVHYRFLLQNDLLPLPSPRTIRRYMSVVNIHCGFDTNFFELLKKRLDGISVESRHGILRIDDMTEGEASVCSSSFAYKSMGNYVDTTTTDDDDNDGTTNGFVMMFKAIADDYAQPIAVFTSKTPFRGPELTKIIVKAIILLHNAGAIVHAVVSDGSTTVRQMWTNLGITGKKGYWQSSFTHPCDEAQRIFVLSDSRRLVWNVRNRLYDNRELLVDPEESPVKWCHFEALLEEEKKLPDEQRISNEITDSHVILNTSTRMKIRLATQIFSESVVKGLRHHRKQGATTLDDCEPTVQFCQKMNDLFGALDRKLFHEGVVQRGKDMHILQASLRWLDDWESQLEKGLITSDQFLDNDTAEALRMTLQSTIDMCNRLYENFDFNQLLTGKINDASLDQLFETIRQPVDDDHSATPTFLQLYKLLSTHSILKPPVSGSCTIVDQQAPQVLIGIDDEK